MLPRVLGVTVGGIVAAIVGYLVGLDFELLSTNVVSQNHWGLGQIGSIVGAPTCAVGGVLIGLRYGPVRAVGAAIAALLGAACGFMLSAYLASLISPSYAGAGVVAIVAVELLGAACGVALALTVGARGPSSRRTGREA